MVAVAWMGLVEKIGFWFDAFALSLFMQCWKLLEVV
jgi:hypothetical protein